jgi:flavin reductase (DIM6/NTAB) family NADH-FMN oxidoreductase RutF
VVTTGRPGGIQGITVSSFCSLSLEPPQVLICIGHAARSHDLIRAQGVFAVNILRQDQRRLSELAAGREGDTGCWLEAVESRRAATGAPVLRDCLAWLDCRIVAEHPGGDHTIFIGRVEAAGHSAGRPLLWFGSGYHRLAGPPPVAGRGGRPARRGRARAGRGGVRARRRA